VSKQKQSENRAGAGRCGSKIFDSRGDHGFVSIADPPWSACERTVRFTD